MTAGSQSALREANAARIIEAIQRFGSLTQVELSEATRLSPATVSTIVKQLLEAGAIETRTTTRSGRRAQLVTLAHSRGLVAGVHVSPRSLRLAIADTSFTVLAEQFLPLRPEHRFDTTLDRVALLLVEQVEQLGSTLEEVLGIGVALPAPVHPQTGEIAVPGIMRGWEDVDLQETLEARLQRPVQFDNDANLAALAETRFGAGRGTDSVLYIRASYGVGAGLVVGGDILRGPRGTAGEIGHVLADPLGQICICGSRGCLDTVVGAQALVEALRVSRGSITLADLLRLASEGDPGSRQVITDAGGLIGTHVANLAVAADPSIIVIGGELAATEDLLLEPIRAAVSRRVLLGGDNPIQVVRAELGAQAEVRGALAAAADLSPISGGVR